VCLPLRPASGEALSGVDPPRSSLVSLLASRAAVVCPIPGDSVMLKRGHGRAALGILVAALCVVAALRFLPIGSISHDPLPLEIPAENTELRKLSIRPGVLLPGFSSRKRSYKAFVPHSADNIGVLTCAKRADAVVRVLPEADENGGGERVALDVGRNVITLHVSSASGRSGGSYRITVIRPPPTPLWARVREHCPWASRDSAGEAVFGGRMWILGGWTPEFFTDVWSSVDGRRWVHLAEIPSTVGIDLPLTFVHDGKLWVTCGAELWSTSDGSDWQLVTATTPWAGRIGMGGTVFRERMWVLGGRSRDRLFNDVWSSKDGVDWVLEDADAAWSKREPAGMVVAYADKIWLLGGGVSHYHPFIAHSDVWASEDGRQWAEILAAAPWRARIWGSAVVHLNRLWVLGGFRSEPRKEDLTDIWYSSDGLSWRQFRSATTWPARHEPSVLAFDGKLWVMGGAADGIRNDVWCLDVPGLTFLSEPVIEGFVTVQYRYGARADFNKGNGSISYRLTESPTWLAIDTSTGSVHGVPDAVGDYAVTVEALDGAGERACQSYTLHVLPVPETTHPFCCPALK